MPLLRAHPIVDSRPVPRPPTVEVDRLLRLNVPIIVRLAERKLLLSEVMRLGVGAIIEFVKSSSEPLDLMINNKIVGQGETVKIGENFGLRITRLGDVKNAIQPAGKA